MIGELRINNKCKTRNLKLSLLEVTIEVYAIIDVDH